MVHGRCYMDAVWYMHVNDKENKCYPHVCFILYSLKTLSQKYHQKKFTKILLVLIYIPTYIDVANMLLNVLRYKGILCLVISRDCCVMGTRYKRLCSCCAEDLIFYVIVWPGLQCSVVTISHTIEAAQLFAESDSVLMMTMRCKVSI